MSDEQDFNPQPDPPGDRNEPSSAAEPPDSEEGEGEGESES